MTQIYGDTNLQLGARAVVGTAMLGNEFGTIKSCRCRRSGEMIPFDDGGGALRGIVIRQPGFEASFEVAFEPHVEPPGPLARVTIPFVGLVGRVMPGAEIAWTAGKERGLTFAVTQWDSLVNASAWRINPVTGVETLLDTTPTMDGLTADNATRTADTNLISADAA